LIVVIKIIVKLEVNMKNSQSKFANDKSKSASSQSSSSASSSAGGCCCGSKLSDEIDEVDFIEVDEK
jgi:hypothetical protein